MHYYSSMQVSIIIVNYNTKELLYNCLKSIYKYTKDIDFEIIVSDNGSTDNSISMLKTEFPQVVIVDNGKNLGFGAGNNKGLEIAKGKYIFYLNSDTLILNNAVKIFYDYFEANDNGKLGALGANLLNANNQVIHSYESFPGLKTAFKELFKMSVTNFILSCLYILHISPNKFVPSHRADFFVGNVDFITGADIFMKNNDDARFDEDFFLYFEDTDLNKRLCDKDKERQIIDGPLIQHLCGGSVGSNYTIKRKATFSRIQFELSRVLYLRKHSNSKTGIFLVKVLITLIWLNPFLLKNTKKFIKELWTI